MNEDTLAPFDVERCRREFPSLAREVAGLPAVFLDGPAGSQVPRAVVDAMARYMLESNANSGGRFVTSRETQALADEASRGVADLLGTEQTEQVVFGPNMTTLTQALARALAREWAADDEIVVTRLDHDANFTPWIQAATDAGATVRRVDLRRQDCTLDLDDLQSKLNERTRLVAVGAAANSVGTINPVAEIVRRAHAVGSLTFVDAVHYAPHAAMDVAAWDCDFVVCSAYKFFGPHVGLLWGKREPMASAPAYKLRPVSDQLPHRWDSGTPSYEGIAGTLAAIDYLAGLGRATGSTPVDRRSALLAAFEAITAYERTLAQRLLGALGELADVRLFGITDPTRMAERVPTISFTHARHDPEAVASHLAERGIFAWHGNFYALAVTEALGLEPHGMVRIGLMHYNTANEVDRLVHALRELP